MNWISVWNNLGQTDTIVFQNAPPLERDQPSLGLFKRSLKTHLFWKPIKTQGTSHAMQMSHYKFTIIIIIIIIVVVVVVIIIIIIIIIIIKVYETLVNEGSCRRPFETYTGHSIHYREGWPFTTSKEAPQDTPPYPVSSLGHEHSPRTREADKQNWEGKTYEPPLSVKDSWQSGKEEHFSSQRKSNFVLLKMGAFNVSTPVTQSSSWWTMHWP